MHSYVLDLNDSDSFGYCRIFISISKEMGKHGGNTWNELPSKSKVFWRNFCHKKAEEMWQQHILWHTFTFINHNKNGCAKTGSRTKHVNLLTVLCDWRYNVIMEQEHVHLCDTSEECMLALCVCRSFHIILHAACTLNAFDVCEKWEKHEHALTVSARVPGRKIP